MHDYLLLLKGRITPEEVMGARNAEVRRYLIKRVGYEKIKRPAGASVIHADGTSELLLFTNTEQYVKVKDSSTDRVYLLYVPSHIKTCKAAIAWTFGLNEQEYDPIIET
jgi:hypothetical protein